MEKTRRLNIIGVIRVVLYISLVLIAALVFRTEKDLPDATTCVFHIVTGFDCAGCGATRAFVCLLHFRFADAFAYNPLFTTFIAPATLIVVLQDVVVIIKRLFSRKDVLSAVETLFLLLFGKKGDRNDN